MSTNAVMPVNKQGSAQLICKDDGVICGLDVFFRTFRLLDDTARFDCAVQDGDRVQRASCLAPCTATLRPFSPASARRRDIQPRRRAALDLPGTERSACWRGLSSRA